MDSIILTGPGGSSIQIGSWLDLPNGGADYGTKGLIQAQFVDNPFSEGGLSFEDVGPRHMAFPLLLNTAGVASLTQVESVLRQFARPGGYIDVKPEGVPTAEAVRFDLLTGRWEPAYDTYLQRVDRRRGTLYLDTPPYGYWPTWITLASQYAALPAEIAINGAASIIGDAPGWAEVRVVPTSNASYAVGVKGVYAPDSLLWAFSGASQSLFYGASVIFPVAVGGTYVGDSYAPVGSVVQRQLSTLTTTFSELIEVPIASTPNFPPPGRYRAFVWARTGASGMAASGISPVMFSMDVAPPLNSIVPIPLASAAQVATLMPAGAQPSSVSTGNASVYQWGAYGPVASMLFQQLDLGPIHVPSVAAPAGADLALRLWCAVASTTGNQSQTGASPIVNIGGIMLVEEPQAGIVRTGLSRSITPAFDHPGGVLVDSLYRRAVVTPANIASLSAIDNAMQFYAGAFPQVGPSVAKIQVLGGLRVQDSITGIASHSSLQAAAGESAFVSVRYRPRFQFLKGL